LLQDGKEKYVQKSLIVSDDEDTNCLFCNAQIQNWNKEDLLCPSCSQITFNSKQTNSRTKIPAGSFVQSEIGKGKKKKIFKGKVTSTLKGGKICVLFEDRDILILSHEEVQILKRLVLFLFNI
jgi:hypothetical protein